MDLVLYLTYVPHQDPKNLAKPASTQVIETKEASYAPPEKIIQMDVEPSITQATLESWVQNLELQLQEL